MALMAQQALSAFSADNMNFWDRAPNPGYKRHRAQRLPVRGPIACPPPARVLVPVTATQRRSSGWPGTMAFSVDGSAVGLARPARWRRSRAWYCAPLFCRSIRPTGAAIQRRCRGAHLHYLPAAPRAVAHRRWRARCAQAAWLILETFHPLQLRHTSGGPKDAGPTLPLDLLRANFAGCARSSRSRGVRWCSTRDRATRAWRVWCAGWRQALADEGGNA